MKCCGVRMLELDDVEGRYLKCSKCGHVKRVIEDDFDYQDIYELTYEEYLEEKKKVAK